MRGSRIFAGIVIIVLVAMALIYLDRHGYFNDQRINRLGLFKSDETAPRGPAPGEQPVATTTNTSPSANSGPQGDANPPVNSGLPPAVPNTRPGTAYPQQNEALTTAQQAAANVPTRPGNSQTIYVDANGNVCRPMQVPRATPVLPARNVRGYSSYSSNSTVSSTHWHAAPRNENWTWAPHHHAAYSTPCGLIHQTANGERVVNLPAGMVLNVALDQDLSSSTSHPGQGFTGYLVGPITYCGEVIVPAGAQVSGNVVSASHRAYSEGEATLQLRLTSMQANGFRVDLPAASYNHRSVDEMPYTTTSYMNDPNYIKTERSGNRDVTLPAQSVVSFWLQNTTSVSF